MKKMRMNKKGISAVVATVLIILITVAAVTIIWAAIIPMIKDQTTGGTTCLDAVSQVSIGTDGGYTCYKLTDDKVQIQVKLGATDVKIEDVQIIVSTGGDTESFDSTKTPVEVAGTMPAANGQSILEVELSYDITATAFPSKVEIAPIVSVGQTDKTCEIAASAVLSACSVQ